MTKDQDAAEEALHDQTQILPKKQLLVVFGIMSLALLACFIDQNSIGVLQPAIARDLHAQSSISWTGTSSLIANTTFQVLYGRLSDLFGRKNIMISALVLLSLSDLGCSLAVSPAMLYVFRGLAGVAGGGITSLSMMIVSDIVTLQERGKYQGILGASVGGGNAIGPLIATAFLLHGSWRGIFYLLAPLSMVMAFGSWWYLPTNMPKLNLKETISKIDILGIISGTAAVIILLIPTSEGGRPGTPWDSPMVIAMFSVGGVCLIAFILIEWKVAKLPMMPLDMFRKISVAAILTQTFLFGMGYYSYLYFVPLYFQNVLGVSPLITACYQLPWVVVQAVFSTLAGYYQSTFNRYAEILWVGFATWTLGAGLMILNNATTSPGLVTFFLAIIGFGSGLVFQPTLVALQAHCSKAQRAVATSNRNFLRSAGAAVGLAVSSAILGNVLKSSLPPRLAFVANSTFAIPNLSGYSDADREIVKHAYAAASRAVFIWLTPLSGICFLLNIFVKDRGLVRKEEMEAATFSTGNDEVKSNLSANDIEKSVPKDLDRRKDFSSKTATIDAGAIEDGQSEKSPNVSRKPSWSSDRSSKIDV